MGYFQFLGVIMVFIVVRLGGSYDSTNVLNVSFVSKFLYGVIFGAALLCLVKHRFASRKT